MSGERKVLASIGAGSHGELLELTAPSFHAYAHRHSYDVILKTQLPAPERPASWSKIKLVRALLDKYDFPVWGDADAMIVDPGLDVLEFMDGFDLGLVAHQIGPTRIPNFGIFAVRSTTMAKNFLDCIWGEVRFWNHKWWENAAVLHLLGYQLEPEVRLVTPSPMIDRIAWLRSEWNSVVDDWALHPRIAHYSGHDQAARLLRLGRLRAEMLAAASSVDRVADTREDAKPNWSRS